MKPPHLVLIPGYMLDETMWDAFVAQLPSAYTVERLRLGEEASIGEMAQRLGSGLGRPSVVVGFSLGGYVARAMAAAYPTRVAGLVLVASSARVDSDVQAAAKARSLSMTDAEHYRGLSRGVVAQSLGPANAGNAALVERIQGMGRRLGYGAFKAQSQLSRANVPLAELRCPTLVIAAADDRLRTREESIELADAIDGARLAVIPDSGHMIPMEQPARLASTIVAWIEENPAEGRSGR